MRKNILLLILTLFFLSSRGQSWLGFRSPAAAGMSSSGLMEQDVWSAFGNPAGLATKSATMAGAGVSNRFVMKEFSNKGLAFSAKIPGAVVALAGAHYGDASYSEQRYNIALSKQLAGGFWSGITLDYCHLSQGGGYGSAGVFTFSAGILSQLSNEIMLGAYLFNPIKAKPKGPVQAEIPALMRLGLSYDFSPEMKLLAEVEKASNQKAGVNIGAQYRAFEKIYLRGGVNTYPGTWSFGVGLHLGKLQMDLATEMHPTLGICPHAAISYVLKSN